MSDQQKTPLARTLSSFATQKAQAQIGLIGLRLPGHVVAVSGQIVTVNFDVSGVTLPKMTMAVAGTRYCRSPIQIGDEGYATTADAYLGGVTGLGGGAASLTQHGNLSALVWVPLGNKSWSAIDPTSQHLESANGLFTVDVANGGITMSYNGSVLLQINTSGQVLINGRVFMNHSHNNTGGGTYTAPSGGGLITGDSGGVV